ncbi:RCC1-like G exchanging factor-like protein [Varroa jacobsoni]|uniref:RCC1-like G exchanging factor-like protein n=1 Tax=Varroa jacobsoni TaxID=62625 RepID=UPI000BF3C0B8|nr:RCC1-like G exchanging factor-like protein [Varroa jacobsoni]
MLRTSMQSGARLVVMAKVLFPLKGNTNLIQVSSDAQYISRRQLQTCAVDLQCFSMGSFKPLAEREVPIRNVGLRKAKHKIRCYLWGGTHSGALGCDHFVRPLKKHLKPREDRCNPYRLRFSATNRVFRIACGNGFTVFGAKPEDTACKYRVFGTGINKDSQIGLQQARRDAPMELLTQPVPIILPESGSFDHLDVNTRNTAIENGSKAPFWSSILSLGAGRAHTVIVTSDAVYTLGNNSLGQCGRPIIENESYFGRDLLHRVEGDGLNNVVKTVCGLDHTFFLTASGKVFACGWGADGQTGLGHYKTVGIPQEVGGDISGERIVLLSSRADCVLALNEKGDLFGWGNNEYGQLLGATKEMQLHTPKHIKLNKKLKGAAAGGSACVVLDENGQVFSWGYGVLGLGPKVEHSRNPRLIPPPLFGANELNPDSVPVRLEAGMANFAAVTNRGHLYTWGRNNNGSLGLGHTKSQMFPLMVTIAAQVRDISMGVDHTAVITQSFC